MQRVFEQAARHAAEYRNRVGCSAPPLPYASMLAAFDMPTPEHGAPAQDVIEKLSRAQIPPDCAQ